VVGNPAVEGAEGSIQQSRHPIIWHLFQRELPLSAFGRQVKGVFEPVISPAHNQHPQALTRSEVGRDTPVSPFTGELVIAALEVDALLQAKHEQQGVHARLEVPGRLHQVSDACVQRTIARSAEGGEADQQPCVAALGGTGRAAGFALDVRRLLEDARDRVVLVNMAEAEEALYRGRDERVLALVFAARRGDGGSAGSGERTYAAL